MRRSLLTAAGLAVLALSFAAPASADLKPTKRVEPQYPAEAARAGTQGFVEVEFVVDEGGKVASVASMWANISDGAAKDEATPLSTVKPKARRSGASPALDFSSPEKSSSTPAKADEEVKPSQPQQRYKSPALKTTSAPHFINTTLPKAVITSPKSPTTLEEPLRAHPQPKPAHGPNGTRIVSAPEAASVAAAAKEGEAQGSGVLTLSTARPGIDRQQSWSLQDRRRVQHEGLLGEERVGQGYSSTTGGQ